MKFYKFYTLLTILHIVLYQKSISNVKPLHLKPAVIKTKLSGNRCRCAIFNTKQHVRLFTSLFKYQVEMNHDKNQIAIQGCTNTLELQLHFGLEFSFSSPEYS